MSKREEIAITGGVLLLLGVIVYPSYELAPSHSFSKRAWLVAPPSTPRESGFVWELNFGRLALEAAVVCVVVAAFVGGRLRERMWSSVCAGANKFRSTWRDCGREDYTARIEALLPLANRAGDSQAQYILGVIYEKGFGTVADACLAEGFYRRAAEQGHALAEERVGDWAWRVLAAEQGNARAQYEQGVDYSLRAAWFGGWNDSEEEEKNRARSFELFRLAAYQGHSQAQYQLGLAYEEGRGTPEDFMRAHTWYNLSAAQGEYEALMARVRIAGVMTPEQIAKAEALARDWKPSCSICAGRRARTPKGDRPRRLESDLQSVAADVSYEMGMFRECCSWLQRDAEVPRASSLLRNAVLEAYLIHLRNLSHFFHPSDSAHLEDILAQDFLPEHATYGSPPKPQTLQDARIPLNQLLAHLSYGRRVQRSAWNVHMLTREMAMLVVHFLLALPEERRGWFGEFQHVALWQALAEQRPGSPPAE